MGAQYGHALNRLNWAVFALLERMYADVPAAPPILTTQARNQILGDQFAERNQQIRQLYAEGMILKDLAQMFGISKGRVHQIIHWQHD
ncbi:MAG: hypothetical protein ABI947_20165 [Chloroflexota bacterium]